MTVTKTELADAYSTALTKKLGDEWGFKFSRKDASKLLETLWPVVSNLALTDTKKKTPGSVGADDSLIFGPDLDGRWESAMAKLGINLHMLSGDAGRA